MADADSTPDYEAALVARRRRRAEMRSGPTSGDDVYLGERRWTWVRAWCPHDPDQLILEVGTNDGAEVVYEFSGTSEVTYVGEFSAAREISTLNRHPAYLHASIPRMDVLDDAHWRYKLRCDRPLCQYDPEIRGDQMETLAHLARECWKAEIAEHDIDGSLDHFLAKVAERTRRSK